jgi:polysaccharide export outer membrane protein
MKRFATVTGLVPAIVGLLSAILFTGCRSHVYYADFDPTRPSTNGPAVRIKTGEFQPGDLIIITFSGVNPPMPQHEEQIKGDGTVTPPFVGPVVAAGKNSGQLQKELQERYDLIYTHINVTVKDSRFYYISGEVNRTGPTAYIGATDLIQAISAAGGFTEFANKRNIQITRAGTRRQVIVNFGKAVNDPRHAIEIYPNDTINVPRSLW